MSKFYLFQSPEQGEYAVTPLIVAACHGAQDNLKNPKQCSHTRWFKALHELRRRETAPVTVPQSLCEFWTVATQPATARGGLALSPDKAAESPVLWERLYPTRDDSPAVFKK